MLPDLKTQQMLESYQALTDENKRYINAIVDALAFAQQSYASKEEEVNGDEQI